jgi:hypothetical protein
MFLIDEIVSKPQLFSSIFLYGVEAILTIIMLVYISKTDESSITKDNLYLNAMLTASTMQ